MKPSVLLATANESKVRWMRNGLAGLPLPVRTLEGDERVDVEEDGTTCEANAWIKARAVPLRPGAVIVAEDSGLFVNALDGRPGTHTARWAPGTDDDRARCLLELLDGVPPERRTARFVSAIAIRFPDGREATVHGELEGRIRAAAGPEGSGYGGVFELDDGRTLSETTGVGAHRLRALDAATDAIQTWLASEATTDDGSWT